MNYRLAIQYDGTDFHGWQMQVAAHGRTVQGELTRVLSLLDGEAVVVHGAGRTDAGVHAVGQVASVRLRRVWDVEKLRGAINGNLERDVRVMRACVVPNEFHARFSAVGKTYCYRVFNEKFMSPFWLRYAHREARSLDVEAMRRATSLFVGEHDWTAFSAAQTDVQTRVRRINALEVTRRWSECGQGNLISIEVSANGFLRSMARIIAGTLLAVGRGEMDDKAIRRAIAEGRRELAGETAPACGLTLERVHY